MANIPIVKIGTDFSSFTKFTKTFTNFKKQTQKPQNIGFKVDQASIAFLKSIAMDLRVIAQIQMGIISKSKRFRDVFESVQLHNPVINGTATDKTDEKKISNFSKIVSKIAQTLKSISASGFKRSLAFGARVIPQPFKDKYGAFSNRISNISQRIKSNPVVGKTSAVFIDAIKKLTSVMMKLTAFTMRAGVPVLGKGIGKLFGALKAVPIVGGLALGAVTGSLFGIGGIASRATGLRSQARNTGLTTGQVLAGKNVLNPYIDFQGWAQQIAQEKTDISKTSMFSMLGVGQNASTSDILIAKMDQAREIARRYIRRGQKDLLGSDYNLTKTLGVSAVQAQALGNLSDDEYNKNVKGEYKKQSQGLNQDDSTTRRLQELNANLEYTSALIKNQFANALVKIAPQIEKLATYFQNLLNNALDSKNLKKITDMVQSGAQKLGEFLKNFSGIGSAFGFLKNIFIEYLMVPFGKMIETKLLNPLGKLFKDGLIEPLKGVFKEYISDSYKKYVKNPFNKYIADPIGNLIEKTAYNPSDYGPLIQQQPEWKTLPGIGANDNQSSSEWKKNRYLDVLNQKIGLPPKFFQALRQLESGGNDFAKNPLSSAAGAFQLTKAAQKDYGVKNPYNFQESATGAGRYIEDAQHMFDNYRKSIVSYHMGKNGADKFFKKYGANWEANLQPKDKDYLRKFEQILLQLQRQQPQQVDININNNTAASPVVNAGMASKRLIRS